MASEQLATLVEMLRSLQPAAPDTEPTIQEMRQRMDAMTGLFPIPQDVTRTAVDAGGVPGEWIAAPGVDPARVILYLHGGGYMAGSIASHRELCARLSRASGAWVLAIDYRLTPEHPFPAAVQDATAAYRWLLVQGAAPETAVIAGDSAGGGLTVATLVALREAGDPLPAAGVCLSPWFDLEGTGHSMTGNRDADRMIAKEGLLKTAAAYLNGGDPRSPLAAPLHADLTGLPPLLLQVGTAETLLDDAVRPAERARAAGVDVTLEPWDDMVHVWQIFAAMLPEGQQAIERVGRFVRERTSAPVAAR